MFDFFGRDVFDTWLTKGFILISWVQWNVVDVVA
jgi:hypothetical protein